LLNYPEKCTMKGKGLGHHLPGKASNIEVVREYSWPKKNP
jgi:hypothetical protein